jgi:hypothetical protein
METKGTTSVLPHVPLEGSAREMMIPISRWQKQLRRGVGTNRKDDGSTLSLGGMAIAMIQGRRRHRRCRTGRRDDGATIPPSQQSRRGCSASIPPASSSWPPSLSHCLLCSRLRDTHLSPGDGTSIASCEARGRWQTMREGYHLGEGAAGAACC